MRGIAAGTGAVLLCARYEGVDQRFIDAHVDVELSVGDYVLSGGELPALILLDAIARLQPGVLGDSRSHEQDSFSAGLLDFPHYSRPERLGGDGAAVPDVLLGGNHAAIDAWRREQSLAPDCFATPGSDRRGTRRGADRRPGRGDPRPTGSVEAIISGFSILCRAGAQLPQQRIGRFTGRANATRRACMITRSSPWT